MEESLHNRSGSRLFTLPVIMPGDMGTLSMGTLGSPTRTASPPISPSASMSPLVRPPTQGGGPLSSHPATPVDLPGAWVSTSDLPSQAGSQPYIDTPPSSASPSLAGGVEPARFDSFRTPVEPASANTQRRGSKGVRNLLSLSSLRHSFLGGSSRKSSLTLSTPAPNPIGADGRSRFNQRAYSANYPQGTKRSASPLAPQPHQDDGHQPLRKKKSASWFRRKSQIFLFGQDGQLMDMETEEKSRPATSYDHRMNTTDGESMETDEASIKTQQKPESCHPDQSYEPPQRYQYYERPGAHHPDSRPQSYHSLAPTQSFRSQERDRRQSVLLPEIEELAGGEFNGGSLDADDMFANIGR